MHTLTPTARRPKVDRSHEAITAFGCPLHRITVEQYHRMQDNGTLRCELIHGYLVEKPITKPPHASAVSRVMKHLMALLGMDAVIRIQMPITLADSEPEPDAVLASGTDED